jgi:hypothetical protein
VVFIISIWSISDILIANKNSTKSIQNDWESRLMFFVAAVIAMRFLIDRPFSAVYGERGGGNTAVYLLGGAISYFVMIIISTKKWNLSRNLFILILLSTGSFIFDFIKRLLDIGYTEPWIVARGLFGAPLWLLGSLLIAYVINKTEKDPKKHLSILVIMSVSIILFLGLITPFRSRPFVAAIMIVSVAYAFRATFKVLPALLTSAFCIVTCILLIGIERLPEWTLRSLSTIIPEDYLYEGIGELGWESKFRAYLLESAWDSIKESPYWGEGLSFSKTAYLSAIMTPSSKEDDIYGLILSGGYHNSIVMLAVKCGLPCAIAFFSAWIVSIFNFSSYLRRIEHNQIHIIGAGLLGYFLASSIQMLMNGGADDFFGICMLMGIMKGFSSHQLRSLNDKNTNRS